MLCVHSCCVTVCVWDDRTLLFAIFNVSIFIFTQNQLFFLGRGQWKKEVRVHLHPIAKLTIIIERNNNNSSSNNQWLKKSAEPKWTSERKQMTQYNSTLCLWARSHKCHYCSFYPLSLSDLPLWHVVFACARHFLKTWGTEKTEKKKNRWQKIMEVAWKMSKFYTNIEIKCIIVVPWGVFNVDVHQFITMLHNGTMVHTGWGMNKVPLHMWSTVSLALHFCVRV